jgi:hypothetical protein
MKRGELDPGYWYFSAMRALGLARARQQPVEAARLLG